LAITAVTPNKIHLRDLLFALHHNQILLFYTSPDMKLALILLLSTALHAAQPRASQHKEFTNWPANTSPAEVGKRVAERFLATGTLPTKPALYPSVCTYYGALTFANLSHNRELSSRLIEKFDQQLTPEVLQFSLDAHHVDYSVLGAVPFEIYLETRQPRYLDQGRNIADHQWAQTTPDGLTTETRYWIDDMYMITILQVQAYRATGDPKYIDRAAAEMAAYLDKLQQPNGLFFHAPDVPFYWGRGNGWVAAGMTELLRSLPKSNLHYARILSAYRLMMKSLLQYQASDGLWRQLIDHPEAWPETSSTAMFTFAMVTGVKEKWLPRKPYAPAARKAWLGLVSYLDENADLKNVCEGTGKKNDLQYYLDRKRETGNLHGQAPMLWAASALLR
jgi:unsaturated rhamnogalacturonyl hydrolase